MINLTTILNYYYYIYTSSGNRHRYHVYFLQYTSSIGLHYIDKASDEHRQSKGKWTHLLKQRYLLYIE